ncbi:DUF3048 domain-containing protein [Cytobacillus kochii]|uniref:DUF3048 domain-containing protein n=1 Tax=Cytobacillus kochii TaxID=859143 RepID=UPI00203B6C95|nr:DUF3048 domain-containing protein [Cytobacillus kochii]MCM3324450.1 DUF3048 domain-containing protein [Cytobacillus kochii]MCM3346843.1 DUF3048 domain-containing protein [Cytobacillus kochii]
MLNKWVTTSLVAILLVTGCSKNETVEDPANEELNGVDNQGEESVDSPEEKTVYPLTGIAQEGNGNQRAIAVMINNHPKARPQSGLTQADIVYELLAEGEVTRFLAIFQSEQPDRVGPVRSAREYYIELAKGFNSLYIAHGNSPEAKKMLADEYVDHLNGLYYDGTLFERVRDRQAPHNSYISFAHIEQGAKEKNYELDGAPAAFAHLTDEEADKLSGSVAEEIAVSYGKDERFDVTYDYDETTKAYKRSSDGEWTTDYDTGDPVLLSNILIIEAKHTVIDGEGRRDIDLTSGGKGYLIQRGMMSEVNWVNKEGRIYPVIDGKEQPLAPGKTWVNVIPQEPGINQSVTIN